MAMGQRKPESQAELSVATARLRVSAGHVFYEKPHGF
jgi:hypothetical protein